jgi:RNA polymerase sigma factor (sigma-70 family)
MTSHDDEVNSLFETWYIAEMPRLFRYVSYRVRDRATAEDLTAAICEAALNELYRYNPPHGALNGWMYGIARNVVRMHYRRLASQPASVTLDNLPEMHAPGRSVEQEVELTAAFRRVLELMPGLTEQEQEVIALRYGAELGNQEIAAVLHLTAANVGVILHRALKRLKHLMILEDEEVSDA